MLLAYTYAALVPKVKNLRHVTPFCIHLLPSCTSPAMCQVAFLSILINTQHGYCLDNLFDEKTNVERSCSFIYLLQGLFKGIVLQRTI